MVFVDEDMKWNKWVLLKYSLIHCQRNCKRFRSSDLVPTHTLFDDKKNLINWRNTNYILYQDPILWRVWICISHSFPTVKRQNLVARLKETSWNRKPWKQCPHLLWPLWDPWTFSFLFLSFSVRSIKLSFLWRSEWVHPSNPV